MTLYNKHDFNRDVATQACGNLLQQAGKNDKLQQLCGVLGARKLLIVVNCQNGYLPFDSTMRVFLF